jgi:predicted aspartyl protease
MPRRKAKTTTLSLEIASIQEDGYHVFVWILVNNRPARMLLDTGASRTVFDIDMLREDHADIILEENEDKAMGLGTSAVDNYIAVIDKMVLNDITAKKVQIGALSLSHVNVGYGHMDLKPIAGVLGSDILMKYKAVISYKDKELVLTY